VQELQEPKSSLHWKLEPLSLELKPRLALVEVVVVAGPEVIEVCGAVVSGGACTVQAYVAGEASLLPAASVARTEKAWGPTAREP
jgi:hypothetical protein